MKIVYPLFIVFFIAACKDKSETSISAQEIVDRSILESGGDRYSTNDISYKFRDLHYTSEWKNNRRSLKRMGKKGADTVIDIKSAKGFERFVNDSLVLLTDSIANLYSNSVNSVHYFANLPFGLNDPAVNKELLGIVPIKNKDYYKVKVTFDKKDGGEDFDDTYLYWFNKETFKPDYLAYKFHVNGGGVRYRVAYNERFVGGIRFVDYENYKMAALEDASFFKVDSLYERGRLKLLSKIELEDISVVRSN